MNYFLYDNSFKQYKITKKSLLFFNLLGGKYTVNLTCH